MTTRKTAVRIGAFDALEDRVVLNAAQNQLIVTDVTNFYSNYVATVPALSEAITGAADATTRATAVTAQTTAITTDVNNLGAQLLKDLGNASAQSIRLAITGSVAGGTDVSNTSGSASVGSLMNTLLAVNSAEPGVMGEIIGINLATNLSMASAVALTAGTPSFPTATFGTFSQQYFGDVAPLAATLKTAQAAASTPPTTDQQTAIDTAVAAIDRTTVSDVNTLATNLLTATTPAPTAAIQQLVTGVSTTSKTVPFTPTTSNPTTGYGSLLGTLQAIESDPTLLTDAGTITGIVSLFAFI